jgi:hypothetical protein
LKTKIALVKFKGYAEHMEYSYITDIDNLKEGEPVVVPTNNSFSVGYFSRYSSKSEYNKLATKWIVQRVDVESYETKMFLGE